MRRTLLLIAAGVVIWLAVVGSLEEVPAYVSAFYPRWRSNRGLTTSQVELTRSGFPGWRTICRFGYHPAGRALFAYYVLDDLPPDEALTGRIMSDTITSDVAALPSP